MSHKEAQINVDGAVQKYLREVIPWQFAKKQIQPEMSLQTELGIDSLGKLAIAFRLEEEFGVDLTQFSGSLEEILTVQDLTEAARQLLEGPQRAHKSQMITLLCLCFFVPLCG